MQRIQDVGAARLPGHICVRRPIRASVWCATWQASCEERDSLVRLHTADFVHRTK